MPGVRSVLFVLFAFGLASPAVAQLKPVVPVKRVKPVRPPVPVKKTKPVKPVKRPVPVRPVAQVKPFKQPVPVKPVVPVKPIKPVVTSGPDYRPDPSPKRVKVQVRQLGTQTRRAADQPAAKALAADLRRDGWTAEVKAGAGGGFTVSTRMPTWKTKAVVGSAAEADRVSVEWRKKGYETRVVY